jgi:hypothetical protein
MNRLLKAISGRFKPSEFLLKPLSKAAFSGFSTQTSVFARFLRKSLIFPLLADFCR